MERDQISRYVPDASIAVKWFVEEEESEKARRLKQHFQNGKIELEAPSLLMYEVASALRFHPVARFTPSQFRTVLESLNDMQILRDPSSRDWGLAFELSLQNPISVYDAIYIGFAEQRRSMMVTADATLRDKLKPDAGKNVIMLADMNL